MSSPHPSPSQAAVAPDTTRRLGFGVVELWVADIEATRRRFTAAFGFAPTDTPVDALPDDPAAGTTAVVGGALTLVLRQGSGPDSPVAAHVYRHGDTIGDVGLVCADPAAVATRAEACGVMVRGTGDVPVLDMLGDRTLCHSLRASPRIAVTATASVTGAAPSLDHVAACLPFGAAEAVARRYRDVLGLEPLPSDSFVVGDVATGMRGVALRSDGVTIVLTEPLGADGHGQTQQFLDTHHGPGVQHLALAYDDVLTAVEALGRGGVEFLPVPDDYYDLARRRLGDRPVPWDTLRRLRVLIDADDDGVLLQLFTRPLGARGTFFLELIQRAGATGFGANNVRDLFAALDRTMRGD